MTHIRCEGPSSPVTDVLGESGGLLRVVSQQSLITGERLHQPHVAGQRHGLSVPQTLLPVTQNTLAA